MPERLDCQNHPPADAGNAGCAVFLIDESAAMEARVADGTKSKAHSIATALNSLLNQLTAGPNLDVAVVGYRGHATAGEDVGCRWGGPLAAETFVPTSQLADSPITVERRVRKLPGTGAFGTASEEIIQFPVWYAPTLGEEVSPNGAYEYCHGLLSSRLSTPGANKPPLVMSLAGEPSEDLSLQAVVGKIRGLAFPGGPPLVFHAHLSSSARIPPTLYPCTDAHLASGAAREVFLCSSILPDELAEALRQFQVTVNAGARGMIYNAKMTDLIRFLSLVKAYSTCQPSSQAPLETSAPPEAETAAAEIEQLALIVLLLDRSIDDPLDQNKRQVWTRLQYHANELLGQISRRGKGKIETAVISCGVDASGRAEVQTSFAGPLAGRTFVSDTDLAGGALRVDEVTEQVSNGIGGLVSRTVKKPTFIELEPTTAAALLPAFETAGRLVAEWCGWHPRSPLPPIVLHLTRARFDPDEIRQAADRLHQAAARGVLLYHVVVTESPHRSLAYPDQPAQLTDPVLKELWELTSPLLGSRRLAAEKRTVAVDSRAIVINGRFDLLLDGVLDGL